MPQLPFAHPAWVEIDLQQFKRNLLCIRRWIGQSKLCITIKANAYGHGLIPIAHAAVEAGVDYFAVSCLQEGAQLREAGIRIPILVMGAIHEEQILDLINYQLEFTIASQYKAELTAKICMQQQKKCRVHVKVDTGMQRMGVRCTTALNLLNYLHQMQCFDVVGVYSHLATADDPHNLFAQEQINLFKKFISDNNLKKSGKLLCHLANSGGICYFPESHLDMVRPGLLAFGYFPVQTHEALRDIAPFFSLKAKIGYFKVVAANQGISYGHTYKTTQETRIVTIPVGYGDGYRRALSNQAEVLIRGRRYPVVGMICMDQFMVDVGWDEAYVGDEVTLIGRQDHEEIRLTDIATVCDTIPYEILCGFNDRLPRLYLPKIRDKTRELA